MDCAASFFSVHKIETIGDSYMAAGGLFQTDDKTQSDDVCHSVDMAFAMCVPAIVYACLHSGLCVRPLACVYGHLVAVAWAPFALFCLSSDAVRLYTGSRLPRWFRHPLSGGGRAFRCLVRR